MRTCLSLLVGLLASVSAAPGQDMPTTQAATAPAVSAGGAHPLLLQPPQTSEDIEARLALARARLATWAAATQPATQPADEADRQRREALAALYAEWQAYRDALERLAKLQDGLAALASEAHLQELSARLDALEAESRQLNATPVPRRPTEEEVEVAAARQKDLDAQLTALSELQARRAAQLATGFQEQRAALERERRELLEARRRLPPPAAAVTATAPASAPTSELERTRLDVQLARLELQQRILGAETELTGLQHKQDERYLEALRQVSEAVQKRRAALSAARSRRDLETLAQQRRQASDPLDRALLDLQYYCEAVRAGFFNEPRLRATLRDTFPTARLDRLRERVARSAGLCDDITRLVQYRAGKDIIRLRRELRRRRADFKAELATLRNHLGETITRLHELQTARDRALDRFSKLAEAISAAAAETPAAERTRLDTLVTRQRAELNESIEAALLEAQQLEDRLREAVELLQDHLPRLRAVEDRLYWVALRRRESGLAGLNWRGLRDEASQLLGRTDQQVTSWPELAALGVPETAPGQRQRLRERWESVWAELARRDRRDWARAVIPALLTLALTLLARFAARRRVRLLDQAFAIPGRKPDTKTPRPGFGLKLRRLVWRLLGETVWPLGWLTAVALALLAAGIPVKTARPLLVVLGLLGAIFLLWRLANLVFHREACLRLAPCGDALARRYRRWAKALLTYSLLMLAPAAIGHELGVFEHSRLLLWEAWKTGLLAALLVFLARKRLVIGCGPGGWGFTLVSAVYPLLVLLAAGLLGLEIAGYGKLVEFIGGGILLSAAVLLLLGLVVEYLCDLVDVLGGAPCPVPVPPDGSPPPPSPKPGTVDSADSAVTLPRLLKSLLRLAAAVTAACLILPIWGGGSLLESVNWWRFVLPACLILLGVVVADRLLLTALGALQLSGRLPASTANMVRRWARGLLTLAAILLGVSLAGYEVQSLWAPLSALLAMVAIGFVAVWSLLSNVLATLMILIWRPFNVGERVSVQPEGIEGEVIDINFLYTLLKTDDGGRVTVPNALFIQKFIQRRSLQAKPQRTLAEQLAADKPVGE